MLHANCWLRFMALLYDIFPICLMGFRFVSQPLYLLLPKNLQRRWTTQTLQQVPPQTHLKRNDLWRFLRSCHACRPRNGNLSRFTMQRLVSSKWIHPSPGDWRKKPFKTSITRHTRSHRRRNCRSQNPTQTNQSAKSWPCCLGQGAMVRRSLLQHPQNALQSASSMGEY